MQIIGHRGFPVVAPENTLSSFRAAIDAGADMVECDVTLTKDGVPIILHDRTLNRTTSGRGLARKKLYKDIQALDAGSWFDPKFEGESIPLLSDLLNLVKGKVPINIEIKMESVSMRGSRGVEEKVLDLVARHGMEESVIISSFRPLAISRIKKMNPKIKTGFLFARALPKNWERAVKKVQADAVHLPLKKLKPSAVKKVKAAGYPVRVYTVNSVEDMWHLLDWGVDGIFTNETGRAVIALKDAD